MVCKKHGITHYAFGKFWFGGAYRTVYLHRIIIGFSTRIVDHINGNGLDNRKENLRYVTSQQNAWNRKANNSLGFIGISKSYNKFYSKICIKGKAYSCKQGFETAEDAARWYDMMSVKYKGQYTRLNFPDESLAAYQKWKEGKSK